MKTEKLLKFMKFFSWLAFIGLMIKSGTILVTYLFSIGNAEVSKDIFEGLNLFEYRNHSFVQYSFIIFYKIILFAVEAYIAFLVITLLQKLNIKQPFNVNVLQLMRRISYGIFYLWVVALIHNAHVQFLATRYHFEMKLFSSDFIFLSGIIFIFAQIVKSGIEIQSENELTI